MHPEGSETEKNFNVEVILPSEGPFVGYQLCPVVCIGSQPLSLRFSWFREQITCSVHHSEPASVQCMSCVALNLPASESFYCSPSCFLEARKKHLQCHKDALETERKFPTVDQQVAGIMRSSGSWPGSLFEECLIEVEQEGRVWLKVGSAETYTPTMDDFGFCLRLEVSAVDNSADTVEVPIDVLLSDPVILRPNLLRRGMIPLQNLHRSPELYSEGEFCNGLTFSILSYNILADLFAFYNKYNYCPAWALAWEYRRENLLREILEYDADIICLQEVQSNHLENFFKPELAKYGYAVLYKRKRGEVYTCDKGVSDGCATFYRRDRFKEIMKYELEFDEAPLTFVETWEPRLSEDGKIHLLKDNVALVVILEALNKGRTWDIFQSRICVANTHIIAKRDFPDVRLFQVSYLINGLEKIAQSQIPVLICGDFNSVPQSDVHTFMVRGTLDEKAETDPFNIYQHLKLRHSLHLESAYASLLSSDGINERQMRNMDSVTREPKFTRRTPVFSKTLDYIMYTADGLKPESLLELLDAESTRPGLPSPLWSSDHTAIMAGFRLTPPAHWDLCPPPLPVHPWL